MAEDKNHWLYVATGWTIAASIFTGYCFWRGDAHPVSTSGLGWFMSVYLWGVAAYEGHKNKKSAER